jgi:hypothetical protein
MFVLHAVVVIALSLAALLIAWLAIERVNRSPHFGALLLFLWLSVMVLFIEHPEFFVVNVGGITIVAADALCTFLAAIAALRFLQRREKIARPFVIPLVLLAGMLLISYVRGVFAFGLQPATNEFREFFYFLSALAFTLSFPVDQLALRLPSISVIGGLLLVAVALVRIPMMGGFGLEQRPLPSYAVLPMGQAFFFGWAWSAARHKSRVWQWLVLGFLLLAVLMLHRSVWVALGAGLLTLFALHRGSRKGLLIGVAIAAVAGTLAIIAFFDEEVILGLHEAAVEMTASQASTFMWRVEGWIALLHPDSGWEPLSVLIGNPMGSGYARSLGNSVLTAYDIESGIIPHNYYISLFLRGGLAGVISLIVLYVSLIRVLLSDCRQPVPHAYSVCFLAILVTQLVYYIPYSADMIQGIFLGGCVVFVSALVKAGVPSAALHEHRYIDDLPQSARQDAALPRVTTHSAT